MTKAMEEARAIAGPLPGDDPAIYWKAAHDANDEYITNLRTALAVRDAEIERLREAAASAYRACMSAWACGEPPHRVKTMIEEVERLGVVIGDAGAVALHARTAGGQHG